jgi:hypothetical protein
MDPLRRPRRLLRWTWSGTAAGAFLGAWQCAGGLEAIGGAAIALGALAGLLARLRTDPPQG